MLLICCKMIMLKVLIHIVAVAALAGLTTGQDASSVESSNAHIKALGAAQIGPSFRTKRDETAHRQPEETDLEENLLTDAENNVKKTGEEIRQIIQLHHGIKKLEAEESQVDTEKSSDSDVEIRTTDNQLEEDESQSVKEQSNSLEEEDQGNEEQDNNEISADETDTSDEQSNTTIANVTDTLISNTNKTNIEDTTINSSTIHEKSPEETTEESRKSTRTEEPKLLPLHFDTSNSKLRKLMMESTDVAKELQNVFEILAEREAKLMEEVGRLRDALTGAVAVVSSKSRSGTSEAIKRCKGKVARRSLRSPNEDPYKACVYIEASAPEYSKAAITSGLSSSAERHSVGVGTHGTNDEIYPPEPSVRVYFPEENNSTNNDEDLHEEHEVEVDHAEDSHEAHHLTSHEEEELDETHKSISHSSHSSSSLPSGDDIDLSKVYWLKLPSSEGESDEKSVMEHKVEEVIAEVKEDGKDALIIPVSRGLSSHSEDLSSKTGFVKHVHPKPAFKAKLRRHLNVNLKSPPHSPHQLKHKLVSHSTKHK